MECVVPAFGTRLRLPHFASATTSCQNVLRVSFLSHVTTKIFVGTSITNHVDARYLLVSNQPLSSSNICFSVDTLSNMRATGTLSNKLALKKSETIETPQYSIWPSPGNRRHTLCSSPENPITRIKFMDFLWQYLLTYLLTYSLTELSPYLWAVNCAVTQELPSILWNLKLHYPVHKSPPLVPILSHIDPIHTISSCLSETHFNIVHPPTSWSSYYDNFINKWQRYWNFGRTCLHFVSVTTWIRTAWV
jgi:hypothetical protein